MDIVEVMEARDGLIARHRAYWGWYSVGLLRHDQPAGRREGAAEGKSV
jgi:hypothetical protein